MEADMKVTRAGGTCLLVMLAIVAFAATSASASLYEVKGLPEMGRSLGSGLRGFRDSINGQAPATEAITAADEDAPAEQPPPVAHA